MTSCHDQRGQSSQCCSVASSSKTFPSPWSSSSSARESGVTSRAPLSRFLVIFKCPIVDRGWKARIPRPISVLSKAGPPAPAPLGNRRACVGSWTCNGGTGSASSPNGGGAYQCPLTVWRSPHNRTTLDQTTLDQTTLDQTTLAKLALPSLHDQAFMTKHS